MSMSDERTGVENHTGTGAANPEDAAAQPPAAPQIPAASQAPGGLPGLAGFGVMQAYSPTSSSPAPLEPQPSAEPQPQPQPQQVQPEAPIEAALQETLEESLAESVQYAPEPAQEQHTDAVLTDAVLQAASEPQIQPELEALEQAYHAPAEESFEAVGTNGADAQLPETYADTYYEQTSHEPAGATALQNAFQAEEISQGHDELYATQDYQDEAYQHPAAYADSAAQAQAGHDAVLGSHSALQTFEARYDQHPEVDLGAYADPGHQPEDQPFFHEGGQADAEFMESEYPVEQVARPKERRGRKMLMVASGLIGALALGGAVAFAYKSSGSGAKLASSGAPPLIQADSRPIKARPDQPGGKEFPHKNKRIYDRIQGEGKPDVEKLAPRQEQVASALVQAAEAPQTGATQGADPVGGHHKVKTIKILPDGTIASTTTPVAPAAPVQVAQPAIPTLPPAGADGVAGVAVAMPVPVTPSAPTAVDPTVTAAIPQTPPQPVAPQPPVAVQPQQAAVVTPPAPVPVQAAPVAPLPNPKPAVPVRTARANPAPAQPAAAQSSIFVVQVASRRSQAMALAAFADLQQKYTSLLGNYQPMIQSADLGNKGTWYRLRVGPMSKKAEAEGLCRKLRGAGLRSCLVRPL